MQSRIAISDDHPIMRPGLVTELKSYKNNQMIAENGDRALEILASLPDILILDLNMPGKHGIDVLKSTRLSDLSIICNS